jgi:hypothetical protein
MLTPPPETDLNDNPLVRGADILAFLKKHGDEIVVEEIMMDFLKQHPKTTADDFMDSISVLFTLGLIDYQHFRIRRKQS